MEKLRESVSMDLVRVIPMRLLSMVNIMISGQKRKIHLIKLT